MAEREYQRKRSTIRSKYDTTKEYEEMQVWNPIEWNQNHQQRRLEEEKQKPEGRI